MDSGESQNKEWFHMDWYGWGTCPTLEFGISDVQTWKSYQRWSYWSFISLSFCTSTKHIHPSIHIWRYSPFRALASLKAWLHSSLFSALLLQPLIPSSCNASLWTTSAHLVLGLPTGLVLWKAPFKTFFGILSSSILIIWPAHPSLLIFISSTMFRSLYRVYSSLFHLGRQRPPSCIGPYILLRIFLSNVFSICSVVCVRVQVTLL